MIVTDEDLLNRLTSAVRAAGGVRRWAGEYGFTPSFVSKVLRRREKVTERMAECVGVQRVGYWQEYPR